MRSPMAGSAWRSLDVTYSEPLAADSPLWDLPNVVIAPHTAAISPHEARKITELFAENARRLLDGEELAPPGRHGRVLLRAALAWTAMTGRLLSLIAIPLSLLGHLLFWLGSAGLLRGARCRVRLSRGHCRGPRRGRLLIAAAMATVAVGSLGVIIIGALQIVFSLLLFLVPFSIGGGFSPAFEFMTGVRS